ncbi:restriction endonuclease subunit S [Bacillus sp. ISL-41]|uniref:restriction endonuclease subunit S n=1 Tax=Bacillus sp. ISL-41 TaxID=2819127 RepID=UPI001BE5E8E7|nr:restriction endonuclease subunit S [Bacillus sp. ISL-41]MBT2642871.1 restriction endonuclease subunit S [Bacillus sp. ISL-41]
MIKVRLGDYVEIDSGFAFKSKLFNENEGIPIIRIRDVNSGKSNTYYSGEYSEKYVVNNGDFLITMDGEFKIREWLGGKALLNQRVCRIKSKTLMLNERYLLYLLPKVLKDIEDKTPFVTVKHLSVKDIVDSLVYIPNITIQDKIVEALDIAKSLVDKRKAQIAVLSTLTPSVFLEMFGDPILNNKKWEIIDFQEVINEIRYGTSTPPTFSDDGFMFIRATNIKEGKVLKKNMLFISNEEASKIQKCKLCFGEIIFVRSGVNSGDNAVITEEFVGHYGGYDIIVSLNEDKVNPFYLNTFFNSNYLEVIIKPLTRRAGQPHLNADQIKSLKIQLPPLDIQNKFVKLYNKVELQQTLLKSSLEQLENNFNSLLQRAFNGELFSNLN